MGFPHSTTSEPTENRIMSISGVGHGGGDATAALAAARQHDQSTAVLAKAQDAQKSQGEAALSLIETAAQASANVISADKVDVVA